MPDVLGKLLDGHLDGREHIPVLAVVGERRCQVFEIGLLDLRQERWPAVIRPSSQHGASHRERERQLAALADNVRSRPR